MSLLSSEKKSMIGTKKRGIMVVICILILMLFSIFVSSRGNDDNLNGVLSADSESLSSGFFAYGISESPENLESNVYIVEFLEEPLIRKKLQLENLPQLALTKPAINNRLGSEKERIEKLHNNFKEDFRQMRAREGVATKPTVDILFEYFNVFNGIAIKTTPEIVEEIKKLPYVKNVEKERFFEYFLDKSPGLIGADYVWNNQLDDYGRAVTGKGIKVAVIDSGVDYTHPDFGSCTKQQFVEGNCDKVVGGFDFGEGDVDPMDKEGHGTHIASTIAGNGVLKGVAPDAKIYAYKIQDFLGRISIIAALAAWDVMTDLDRDGVPFENEEDSVDVVSMSWGIIGGADDELSRIVDSLVRSGIVAVIAVGNSGPDEGTVASPATARNAIGVGATYKSNYESFWFDCQPGKRTGCKSPDNPLDICPDDGRIFCNYFGDEQQVGDNNPRVDQVGVFSSRGPVFGRNVLKPDMVAPGAIICAASTGKYKKELEQGQHPYYYPCIDDQHVQVAGTSMATPIVAGAVALLLQKNPDWDPFEIKQALRNTAVDIGYDINTQGAGRIDIGRALLLKNAPPTITSVETRDNRIHIYGKIKPANFAKYEIYLLDIASKERTKVYEASNIGDIKRNLIASFDISSIPLGEYILELKVYDAGGNIIGNADYPFEPSEIEIEFLEDKGIDENGNGLFESVSVDFLVHSKTKAKYTYLPFLKARDKDVGLETTLALNPLSLVESVEMIEGDGTAVSVKFSLKHIKSAMLDHNLDYSLPFTVELFAYKISGQKLIDASSFEAFRYELKNLYGPDDFEKLVDVSISPLKQLDEIILGESYALDIEVNNKGEATTTNILVYRKEEFEDSFELVDSLVVDLDSFSRKVTFFRIDKYAEREGKLTLKFVAEVESDINEEDNTFYLEINVLPPGPDIRINSIFLEEGDELVEGKDNLISAIIDNRGTMDANDVDVFFYVGYDKSDMDFFLSLPGQEPKDKKKINYVGTAQFEVVNFNWNPDRVGKINLGVRADIKKDINLNNNLKIISTYVVSSGLKGDFNNDCKVDFADFLLFANSFDTKLGDEKYDEKFDLSGNGEIGVLDFLEFSRHYNKECPAPPRLEKPAPDLTNKPVSYIFAGSQRVASINSKNEIRFFHTDHLGGTSKLTDEAGNIVFSADYMPFGTEFNVLGNSNQFKFTGKELDDESGLYYYGARYYDPEIGRFMSADPVPDGVNRYVYVRNNPLRLVDPTGNEPTYQEILIKQALEGAITIWTAYQESRNLKIISLSDPRDPRSHLAIGTIIRKVLEGSKYIGDKMVREAADAIVKQSIPKVKEVIKKERMAEEAAERAVRDRASGLDPAKEVKARYTVEAVEDLGPGRTKEAYYARKAQEKAVLDAVGEARTRHDPRVGGIRAKGFKVRGSFLINALQLIPDAVHLYEAKKADPNINLFREGTNILMFGMTTKEAERKLYEAGGGT